MIGQKELIAHIDDLLDSKTFPKFSIVVGPIGSGKSLVIDYICNKLNALKLTLGKSVEDVRHAISEANRLQGYCTVCVFRNADTMSLQAKNALLKIIEEPPKGLYFIIELNDLSNTLETIQSRAQIFSMQPYTPTEIGEYASKYRYNAEEMSVVVDLCEVPGEVDLLHKYGILKFADFINIVGDNIAEVSGANCFKIGDRINFKDDDSKYDMRLFFKAFITECSHRLSTNVQRYAEGIKITSKYLQDLRINGVNKSSLFDMWILDIRKAWMTE